MEEREKIIGQKTRDKRGHTGPNLIQTCHANVGGKGSPSYHPKQEDKLEERRNWRTGEKECKKDKRKRETHSMHSKFSRVGTFELFVAKQTQLWMKRKKDMQHAMRKGNVRNANIETQSAPKRGPVTESGDSNARKNTLIITWTGSEQTSEGM